MIKIKFYLPLFITNLLLLLSVCSMEAQQWNGSQTTTNEIHRWGRVGIGVVTPEVRLDIQGNVNPAMRIMSPVLDARMYFTVVNQNGHYSNMAQQGDAVIVTGGESTGRLIIASRANKDILFTTGNWQTETTRMSIQPDGKVKIGNVTTPGNYKLYVKDGILTEKIKVALSSSSNWADYVFDTNYELMPLPKLKEYVENHKHLPNIPSSQELVDNGGVELMEMTKLQMEKIEELTLYMIEMNERMEALEVENENLRKELESEER